MVFLIGFSFCPSSSSNSSHPQTPREEDGTQEPMNNFSKYLGWETWVDIANWTNARYNMSNPVTAREVAQFVGIHIAMGTLKVCAFLRTLTISVSLNEKLIQMLLYFSVPQSKSVLEGLDQGAPDC